MDPELQCPNCGYDLQSLGGKAASRCPECGQVPRWRAPHAAFRASIPTWLAGLAALLAFPLAGMMARASEPSEGSIFLAAFLWSWVCIGVALAAGYWRSGRAPAVVHGIIVGGVLAAIWGSACFLLVEQCGWLFR